MLRSTCTQIQWRTSSSQRLFVPSKAPVRFNSTARITTAVPGDPTDQSPPIEGTTVNIPQAESLFSQLVENGCCGISPLRWAEDLLYAMYDIAHLPVPLSVVVLGASVPVLFQKALNLYDRQVKTYRKQSENRRTILRFSHLYNTIKEHGGDSSPLWREKVESSYKEIGPIQKKFKKIRNDIQFPVMLTLAELLTTVYFRISSQNFVSSLSFVTHEPVAMYLSGSAPLLMAALPIGYYGYVLVNTAQLSSSLSGSRQRAVSSILAATIVPAGLLYYSNMTSIFFLAGYGVSRYVLTPRMPVIEKQDHIGGVVSIPSSQETMRLARQLVSETKG